MNNNLTIDRIRTRLVEKGMITGKEIATQGYLRLHQNISTTLSAIKFNILENQGTPTVGERRLKLTDLFTITHWTLMIGRTAAGSAGATPTDSQASLMKLYTNNNLNVFTATGDNLRSIYNGALFVNIDRTTYVDGIDVNRFWAANMAQEGLQQTVTATVGTYQVDGWDGPNHGFALCQPEITCNGAGQNDISIVPATSQTFVPTGNFTNFAVLICRGITWQNASRLNANA